MNRWKIVCRCSGVNAMINRLLHIDPDTANAGHNYIRHHQPICSNPIRSRRAQTHHMSVPESAPINTCSGSGSDAHPGSFLSGCPGCRTGTRMSAVVAS